MNIIWRRLIYNSQDLGDYYEVSNNGDIRNSRTKKIRKKVINKSGYYVVGISLGSRDVKPLLKVHRAVAETFIDNSLGLSIINHIDGNKLNNNVDNLEWCTQKHNYEHAVRMGLAIPIPLCAKRNKVKCIDLNMEFDSVMDCARYLYDNNLVNNHSPENVRKNISRVLSGNRKSVNGHLFEYIVS